MLVGWLEQNYFFFFISMAIFAILSTALVFRYVQRQLDISELADKHASITITTHGEQIFGPDLVKYTEVGLERLKGFAHTKRPDIIMGVHTGGRLASVLLSHAIGIPPNRCGFISTDKFPNTEPFIKPGLNRLQGRILIIDDVTRTGRTLEIIRRKLAREALQTSNKFKSASFATLVIGLERMKVADGFFMPDWWAYFTENPDQSLPWSPLSAAVSTAHLLKQSGKEYDQHYIDVHDMIVDDYQFALFCAQLSLSDNNKFRRLVTEKQLIEFWKAPINP